MELVPGRFYFWEHASDRMLVEFEKKWLVEGEWKCRFIFVWFCTLPLELYQFQVVKAIRELNPLEELKYGNGGQGGRLYE